jgi:mercuric ion transport protein
VYIKAGGIGAIIAAICCFTPVLVIFLGIVGLGAVAGYLDYVLIPALLLCLGVLAYGLVLRKRERAACCDRENILKGGGS